MNNSSGNNTDIVVNENADHLWLPVEALQPGMILAKPVHVAQHGVLTMKLGEGVELQANTIEQLFSRGVECVSIRVETQLDKAQLELQEKSHLERLLQIFSSTSAAEVPQNCREFFDALLKAGPNK